ncbi:hypothetical protein OF83DRAFT_1062495 [Amylostereum chailletii]|nr:hypothetical protein OF83DRAFT_1062495 [Amylostereum chailletii]
MRDLDSPSCSKSKFVPHPGIAPSDHLVSRPSMSFDDGNLVLVACGSYFLVHRGVLCRHSAGLAALIYALADGCTLDGHPTLELQESAHDISILLHALYDGFSHVYQNQERIMRIAFVLLNLGITYQIPRLIEEAPDVLLHAWPTSLLQWDHRSQHMPSTYSEEARDTALPHPIAIINLARRGDIPELLPAAFYDLSRQPPSVCAMGFSDVNDCTHHRLSSSDLVLLFQGREAASRFLSTFIVQAIEARVPSPNCLNAHVDASASRVHRCQKAFQRRAHDIVNDATCGHAADPLSMLKEVVRTRAEPGELRFRLCVICATELERVVEGARQILWDRLPVWFGVQGLVDWGSS